ncbi:unnamed protein product [Blepharisma stoltei]|uniref:Uncharacterized protein n=1 Tax=Blepharisma stoltei TaxID=1481888 RepID=A0AAU9IBR9_9CILI|nr:unnamed protein product [Blepharisma stoltei]
MGAILNKKKLQKLKAELDTQRKISHELEQKLKRRQEEYEISEIDPNESFKFIVHQEQLRALSSIQCLNQYIGVEGIDIENLVANIKALDDIPEPQNNYISLRFEESKIESRVCLNLARLIEKVQEMNLTKSDIISAEIDKIEDLVEGYHSLKVNLSRIREKERLIEEGEDETVRSVSMGLKYRCDLEKEIEIVQRRLKYQHFKKDYLIKVENIKHAQAKLDKTVAEKEDLQAKWDKMKSEDGKIISDQMAAIKSQIEDKDNLIEIMKLQIIEDEDFIEQHTKLDEEKEKAQLLYQKSVDEIQEKSSHGKQHIFRNALLQSQLKPYETLKIQLHSELRNETKLKNLVKYLRHLIGKSSIDLESTFKQMEEAVEELQRKCEEMQESYEEISERLRKLIRAKDNKFKRWIVSRLCLVQRMGTENFFRRWKWEASDKSDEQLQEEALKIEKELTKLKTIYNIST